MGLIENSTRSVAAKSLPVVYVVMVLATRVCFLLRGAAQNTLCGPIGLSSVVAILIGVRRYYPRYALPWYAMADAFYFVGYLVFAAGFVLLARTRDPETGPASLSHAVIVTVGVEGDRA